MDCINIFPESSFRTASRQFFSEKIVYNIGGTANAKQKDSFLMTERWNFHFPFSRAGSAGAPSFHTDRTPYRGCDSCDPGGPSASGAEFGPGERTRGGLSFKREADRHRLCVVCFGQQRLHGSSSHLCQRLARDPSLGNASSGTDEVWRERRRERIPDQRRLPLSLHADARTAGPSGRRRLTMEPTSYLLNAWINGKGVPEDQSMKSRL